MLKTIDAEDVTVGHCKVVVQSKGGTHECVVRAGSDYPGIERFSCVGNHHFFFTRGLNAYRGWDIQMLGS